MSVVLETFELCKSYGALRAVQGLSLQVRQGEVFGFLGPNGAGKTSTIRMLLRLIKPTSGRFTTFHRADTGYLPGELTFWPELSGRATLELLARLSRRAPVMRDQLLERLQIPDAVLRRQVRTYSDGTKQKLGIVQALQCAPRLLMLDEPTKGLDPLMQQDFYSVLEEMRRLGTTIFFSSHVLSEVERLCDRVALLREGRLIASGTIAELRGSHPTFEASFLARYRA